jgi:hypothetical protein
MLGNAQMAPRRREGRAGIVLLVVLLASLIAYKTGPALRAWVANSFGVSLYCISIAVILQVGSALDVRARVARDCLQILVDCAEIVVSHVLVHWPWHDL